MTVVSMKLPWKHAYLYNLFKQGKGNGSRVIDRGEKHGKEEKRRRRKRRSKREGGRTKAKNYL